MKKQLLFFFCLFIFSISHAQKRPKVGLVLSGGGAKGLAHVGVLKVLEANHIPIDYIVGTSMGGIVGAFYAAGFNADELEKIVSSDDFQEWASGKLGTNHRFISPKEQENASFLSFQLEIDSGFSTSFQPQFINDAPLNFALGQYLYMPSKKANYDFDKLPIPFRCVAADIFTQEQVILRSGYLGEAARATMAVPLVFGPIPVDGRYLFDGGLLNNFPADVMREEFKPDIIIGVNVSSSDFDKHPTGEEAKELVKNSMKFLFMDNANLTPLQKGDIYIEPNLEEIGSGDFEMVKEAIKSGYEATLTQLDSIKISIPDTLTETRKSNLATLTDFDQNHFGRINITGLNGAQSIHVRKLLASRKNSKKGKISISELQEGYYRLLSEPYFKGALPTISYYDSLGSYSFNLDVDAGQKIIVELGGNLSSRSVSAGFVGLKYSVLDRLFYDFSLNAFSGRFYTSVRGQTRIVFPTYNPFFIEADITFNSWEYSNTSELVFNDIDASIVDRVDRFIGVGVGTNIGRRNTFLFRFGYGNDKDLYFSDDDFSVSDQLDETRLKVWVSEASYFRSTLNRKVFASEGDQVKFSAKYVNGTESLIGGSTSQLPNQENNRSWIQLRAKYEQYFGHKVKLGTSLETSVTNMPRFSNYKGSLINAPAFYPLLDSKTLFLEDFRAYNYAAAGLKGIVPIGGDNFEFRMEGYGFLPYRKIIEGANQEAELGKAFNNPEFAATAALVYHTPFGPISGSLNYYSDKNYKFGIFFNVGFLLFNNRALGD
ncbi:MAG: NTE family protein [Arenicella sp.]|jgi:NTE family protein